jgi:ABC-2 type transport system permease protein
MFRRALKDLRWMVFWYALGLFLYGLLIMSFYPTVQENAALMEQYMQALPRAMVQAFGVSDMTSIAGFLGGEFLNFMWPLIAGIFLILAGSAIVAREVEQGTIELLLSVPQSRTRLLLAKLAAFVVGLLILVLATIVALGVGAKLVDETLEFENLLALGIVLASFGAAVGGYSVLFSSFSRERGKAAGMAAGLTLAFYLAWVIAGLSDTWEWLKNFSIFSAYKPQLALQNGDVDFFHLVVLGAIGLVCTIVAVIIFRRRDAFPS